jgi:CRISPR-associated protein Cas7/Cst2/DevR subtype I-B
MTEKKYIGMAYLSHGKLGNHNAGEGGSQLSDLKMHDNKPYISGQALRHAVKDALKMQTSDGVECTSTDACGDLGNCKLCDIFGYMNTDLDPREEDGHEPTRHSPLHMTPSVGVYQRPVTTDIILQFGVGGSVKKEEGSDADHGNDIAYRELVENVYHGAWAIDETMIGRRESEEMYSDRKTGHRYEREVVDFINENERKTRANELINALRDHSQLAGQARHMADFMPDLCVAAELGSYNQRIANALQVDEESEELNVKLLKSVCADIVELGGTVYIAGNYNNEIIKNWDELFDAIEKMNGVEKLDYVTKCYEELKYDE